MTLAALYTRIILETNRDDMGASGALEQAKVDAVARAVEFYSDQEFWFNRKSGTTVTIASTATAVMVTGMRIPLVVSISALPLAKVDLETIQYRTETGQPTHWAENEGAIQLWPIPDAVYTLSVQGIAEIAVPASASDNEWTTTAVDLIDAAARKILYRDYLRDTEGAALAKIAEDEALGKLLRETRRRGQVGLSTDLPNNRQSFNINRGY